MSTRSTRYHDDALHVFDDAFHDDIGIEVQVSPGDWSYEDGAVTLRIPRAAWDAMVDQEAELADIARRIDEPPIPMELVDLSPEEAAALVDAMFAGTEDEYLGALYESRGKPTPVIDWERYRVGIEAWAAEIAAELEVRP